MNFKDIPLEISYISVGEDSFSQILNPLLACTKVYKRSVGYFSSSALNFIGDGLLEMARNGGKIYLATSPHLSDEDILAIKKDCSGKTLVAKLSSNNNYITYEELFKRMESADHSDLEFSKYVASDAFQSIIK